ncbi:MAG: wax ester/triacylglycerol synthase domain-containing protein, partial [Oceanococcaceae bacterium]
MKQLSGLDAMFLYWETEGASMHTAMVHVYDPATAPEGQVDFATVREHLRQCLPLSNMFRQRLAPVPLHLDHPYWIQDPDFDLNKHVRKVDLAEPSWEAYCQLIAELHAQPLKRDRPLWELIYIDGLGGVRDFPPGAFALMLKMHHAAIDGASSAGIVAGLHDLQPDTQRKVLADTFVAEAPPSTAELLLRSIGNNLRAPIRLAGPVQRLLPGVVRNLRQRGKGDATTQRRGPKTRFNGRVKAERIYEAREYPLAELSAIRKAVPGATVNDVILCLSSGGIRAYLQYKSELPPESLIGMVPISTRGEGPADGGNEVTLMMLPLHTEIGDPLQRLAAIVRESA